MDVTVTSISPPVGSISRGIFKEAIDVIVLKLKDKAREKFEEKVSEEKKAIQARLISEVDPEISDTEARIIVASVPLPGPAELPQKVAKEVENFVGGQVYDTIVDGVPKKSASLFPVAVAPAVEVPPMWRRDP